VHREGFLDHRIVVQPTASSKRIPTADHQHTGTAAQTVQDPLHLGRLKITRWIVTQDYQLVLAVAQITVSRLFGGRVFEANSEVLHNRAQIRSSGIQARITEIEHGRIGFVHPVLLCP
jgi:hypothetical protein